MTGPEVTQPDPALSGPEAPVPALTLGERIRLAADGPDVPAHTKAHLALLATDADTLTRVGERLVAARTQPDPDGGVEMTDGEFAAFRGIEVTAAMKAEDVPAEWVEASARALARRRGDMLAFEGDYDPMDVLANRREGYRRQARSALAAAVPLIVAKAFQDAADETERYGADTYWRDDSPFHAQGRFHATEHAKRLRAGAAGWLITTTEEPTT